MIDIFFVLKALATLIAMALAVRTWLWWTHMWQRYGYRTDRLRDHSHTTLGQRKIWNLWFFDGILPRPQFTLRALMVLCLTAGFSTLVFGTLVYYTLLPYWVCIILIERLMWLNSYASVLLSKIFVQKKERQLYAKAKRIRKKMSEHITIIAMTGSYGKTSTKEMLVHLLQDLHGAPNVLYTPENANSEIAIARLIINHQYFFDPANTTPRYFVVEMGAYKIGEIAQMCDFVKPHHSFLIAVGTQHMALFGSQANIQRGKFEIAQNTSHTVWYNHDNTLVTEAFQTLVSRAEPYPVSVNDAKEIHTFPHKSTFVYNGQLFTLPWGGEFFLINALLCIRLLEYLKHDLSAMAKSLPQLPPLIRGLSTHTTTNGALVLLDPYAASEHGVLAALDHLHKAKGTKVFVCIPLVELGRSRARVHKEIFEKLNAMQAYVFWMGPDYTKLGQNIIGERFYTKDDFNLYKKIVQNLGPEDAILLESRIPEAYVHTLSGLENIKLPVPH